MGQKNYCNRYHLILNYCYPSNSGEMSPLEVGTSSKYCVKRSSPTYEHAEWLGDDQVHIAGVSPGGQRVAEPGGGRPPGSHTHQGVGGGVGNISWGSIAINL